MSVRGANKRKNLKAKAEQKRKLRLAKISKSARKYIDKQMDSLKKAARDFINTLKKK